MCVPPDKQISDALNLLRNEYGTASNIKSNVTRKNILDAIVKAQQKLKLFKDPCEKGIVGKPCSACKAPSFTIVDKKDIVDELGHLVALANTDVEVISGETEERTMLKNAFGGIAAILGFKIQG